MKKRLFAMLMLVVAESGVFAATAETVFFLGDDLKSAISYRNIRYDSGGQKSMIFSKDFDKTLISYARPENFQWTIEDGQKALQWRNTSNYSFLQRKNNSEDFLVRAEGYNNRYIFMVDGSTCLGAGCLQDENIISVAIPKKFKVINYKSTDANWKELGGKWKVIDNTYTVYNYNIKGAQAVFTVEDLSSNAQIFSDVTDSLSKYKEIRTEKSGNNVKVIMPVENLFDSGSAEMKKVGLEWMKTLASTLKKSNFLELRIEGHTDNSPIKSTKFPSNWELSSARASNVVKYFIGTGFESQKLAAVGYADSRPIASNTTADGKAKNRRIEFTIVTTDSKIEGTGAD